MTTERRPRAFVLDDAAEEAPEPAPKPLQRRLVPAAKPEATKPEAIQTDPKPRIIEVARPMVQVQVQAPPPPLRPAIKPTAFILPEPPLQETGRGNMADPTVTRVSLPDQQAEIEFAAEPETSDAIIAVPETIDIQPSRRTPWGKILFSAVSALIILWAGLTITQLVESFFARNAALGWIATVLAALAATAALAIILREVWSIWRLKTIEDLQEKSARAINLDERAAAEQTVAGLVTLYADRQDMRWSLDQLKSHGGDIIDPSDRVALADRILLEPLDEQAARIIGRRAKRVTLMTTVTPVAALDILFVAAQNLAMLREIATLYGGKPSAFATWRLGRMVLTHLAVTGGLALSDNILQHIVGKGLLGRLSARFGEGAINGIMTSRIGVAAISVCRPIPREKGKVETLASLLKGLLGGEEKT
jgi:putative membrane protein